jgi:hypothetical protein
LPNDWRGWSTRSSGRSKRSGRSRRGKGTSLRGYARFARRSCRNSGKGGLSDAERDRRWDQLARLYLAQQLSLYPAGYLEGYPSTERVLETVERLEEDLTDVATVHRPLAVTVSVGEPLAGAADGPRPAALTNDVRDRIETRLDIRSASDRAPAGGPG